MTMDASGPKAMCRDVVDMSAINVGDAMRCDAGRSAVDDLLVTSGVFISITGDATADTARDLLLTRRGFGNGSSL